MNHPFTPTFILQAKAAEEIQAMRPDGRGYQDGDAFASGKTANWIGEYLQREGETPYAIGYGDEEVPAYPDAWLPRLDQLLGMLGGPEKLYEAVTMTDISGDQREFDYQLIGADWHELALGVVMREKFGKTWREGKWVTG